MMEEISRLFIEKVPYMTMPIPFSGCIVWMGNPNKSGYGQFHAKINGKRKNYLPHRISYFLSMGSIDPSRDVCHSCDVKTCINPDHLFLGTRKENMMDASRKGRINSYRPVKLSERDVREIRISPLSYSHLSKKFGVGYTTIAAIIQGRTWKHVS